MPDEDVLVEVGVEDGAEVDLDHSGRHPRRHVAHLLQVLLLRVVLPCWGQCDVDVKYRARLKGRL